MEAHPGLGGSSGVFEAHTKAVEALPGVEGSSGVFEAHTKAVEAHSGLGGSSGVLKAQTKAVEDLPGIEEAHHWTHSEDAVSFLKPRRLTLDIWGSFQSHGGQPWSCGDPYGDIEGAMEALL